MGASLALVRDALMLAVLVNPNARAVRRDPSLPSRLAAIVRGAGEVIATRLDELPDLARSLKSRGTSTIALCGGDGTGQHTLTALVGAYGDELPKIALLGGGTMNTIARNLGVRDEPAALLARLVANRASSVMTQPLLDVNGRVGFLFAAALGARFLQRYDEDPRPAHAARLAAHVAVAALTGGSLAREMFDPVSLEADVDGSRHRLDARLVIAGTVSDVGLGVRILPRATHAPERFELVLSALSPSALARQLPTAFAGHALRGAPHVDVLCRHATLRFDRDEPCTVDGELFTAREVTIAIAATLQLVRP